MKLSQARLVSIALLLGLLLTGAGPSATAAPTATLTLATGQPDLFAPALARYSEANPGVEVTILPVAASATDQLALYRQALERQSPEIDIFDIDVTWTALMASHLIDLRAYLKADAIGEHFPVLIEESAFRGRLVGLPYSVDVGVLYYRPDLLEEYGYGAPPPTWDALEEMARAIQDGERAGGNPNFWGYVWQGERYEALVCNALEWLGERLVTADGRAQVNTEAHRAALERAAAWPGTISPLPVTAYVEEDSRALWMTGNVAFMRNWTVVARTSVAFDFAVAPLPAGESDAGGGCLRGAALGVSRYSRRAGAAAALVAFLTGEDEQRRRAVEFGINPTRVALYDDPDVLTAMPTLSGLHAAFAHALPRPAQSTGPAYDQVAAAYAAAVHDVLTGETDALSALTALDAVSTQALSAQDSSEARPPGD